MNVNIYFLVLFYYFVYISSEPLELVESSTYFTNESEWDGEDDSTFAFLDSNKMNVTVQQTVSNFYCCVKNITDTHVIVYGTQAWTFPPQDVNLTLTYPSTQSQTSSDDYDRYIITGFRVTLYITGVRVKGYITEGGVLQESISLSFVSHNISSLSYQFWLYGTQKFSNGIQELNAFYYMC